MTQTKIYPNSQQRPHFRAGQKLTPERLNRIQAYLLQRSREVLSGVAGVGVVHGFDVACRGGKVHISRGVALDRFGRMLELEQDSEVSLAEILSEAQKGETDFKQGWYALHVHYAELTLSNRAGCGCPPDTADYVQEGVVFSLALQDEKGADEDTLPSCLSIEASPECLSTETFVCEQSKTSNSDNEASRLCHVAGDGSLYDREAGVVIAGLLLEWQTDECGGAICCKQADACGERSGRQLIYPNPLLFGLLNNSYTRPTRITGISIGGHQYEPDKPLKIPPDILLEDIKEFGCELSFSRPVKPATLWQGGFYINGLFEESASDWLSVTRLPFATDSIPEKSLSTVPIHFTGTPGANGLQALELVIRTSLVCDAKGCLVDGRPLGKCAENVGTDMVGSDFTVVINFGQLAECEPVVDE